MLYYAKQGTNGKCLMEECEFMKTECPFCNQHCEVEDELIDKVVECPKCKAEFCVQPLSEEQIIIPSPQNTYIVSINFTKRKVNKIDLTCIQI